MFDIEGERGADLFFRHVIITRDAGKIVPNRLVVGDKRPDRDGGCTEATLRDTGMMWIEYDIFGDQFLPLNRWNLLNDID